VRTTSSPCENDFFTIDTLLCCILFLPLWLPGSQSEGAKERERERERKRERESKRERAKAGETERERERERERELPQAHELSSVTHYAL
jgi:hypothetical protein